MTNEIFHIPGGTMTVQPMWGGARVVGHYADKSKIGKTQYPSVQAALNELRANSTRVGG